MSRQLTRIPLCGDCEDGWIVDEDSRPIERCPCRQFTPDSGQRRDRGIRQAELAHPGETKAARKIVEDAAYLYPEFSANQTRAAMQFAQINNRNVIGGAFRWAAAQGLIKDSERMEPSKDPATNAHRIVVWTSLKYGQPRPDHSSSPAAAVSMSTRKEAS